MNNTLKVLRDEIELLSAKKRKLAVNSKEFLTISSTIDRLKKQVEKLERMYRQ